MSSVIENIYQSFMTDPNFMIGTPEHEKKEKAWALAWERYKQTQRNNVALSMAKEEEIAKESVGTMGPDSGPSKYPAKIGGPTTIENTKKFGQERINLHRDPNRTWRTRPETASEMTTDKDLEKINPLDAAKKFFSKPKTLEEKETERIRREIGFSKIKKDGPPSPGLVPKSGSYIHPYRWIRPQPQGKLDPSKYLSPGEAAFMQKPTKFVGADELKDLIERFPATKAGEFATRFFQDYAAVANGGKVPEANIDEYIKKFNKVLEDGWGFLLDKDAKITTRKQKLARQVYKLLQNAHTYPDKVIAFDAAVHAVHEGSDYLDEVLGKALWGKRLDDSEEFNETEKSMYRLLDTLEGSSEKGQSAFDRVEQGFERAKKRGLMKGNMLTSKQEMFKAHLKKHLTDTLDEEGLQAQEISEEENADSEMAEESEIILDTIIGALTELKDRISQHEMDEQTGQNADGEESFGSPENELEVLDSIEKHENFSSKPHEHLPWGQVKVPKPKGASWESGKISRDPVTKKPGAWQGYVEKKDFKDLDFKDQDAVKAEAEMFARGKLKKPVAKQIDSRGKSGTFNVQGAADFGVHPADKLVRQLNRTMDSSRQQKITSTLANKYGVSSHGNPNLSPKSGLEKHEDYSMHSHAGKDEKYPFISHILPPTKIKTEPVKKDTSSISEITEVQKKIINPFAVATAAAKKAGYSDFSEGSPGKEKRSEIAESIKEKEGIKKEAQKTLYNVLSNRKYAAPETSLTAMPPSEYVREQKRVEG